MNRIGDIIAGIGFLIAIFLFLSRPEATTNIINSIANASVSSIRVLQGRG